MDPLSMTASIIVVLQMTATLTSHINDVRHASKEQAKVATEARGVYSLLTHLRFCVREARTDDLWFNQVKLLNTPNGPLDQFKMIPETMVAKVESKSKLGQIKDAITWTFSKAEATEALNQIE